jgi:hypothetical protein
VAKHWSKIDPSKTKTEQEAYKKEIRRRLKDLYNLIYKLLVVEDAFGLENISPPISSLLLLSSGHIKNKNQYKFMTDPQKLTQFQSWLQSQISMGLLEVIGGDPKKPWTAKYVLAAYRKGILRAYADTHKEEFSKSSDFYRGGKEEFLKSAFLQPEIMSKVEMLATRSFEGMKGMTQTISSNLSRILADGMSKGNGPTVIAREIRKQIGSMSKSRASMISRTEVIHAHAEGQLDGFEALKVYGVVPEIELDASGNACDICKTALKNNPYTIQEARGVIPLHPNCFINGDTPILTFQGWVAIKNIGIGMKVFTHKRRFKKVTSLIRVHDQFPEMVEIQVECPPWVLIGQRRIQMTADHPILCGNSTWFKAGEMQKGFLLKFYYLSVMNDLVINNVKKWKVRKPKTLFNFSVEEDESYIAKGFVVHNCRCCWSPAVK